MLIGRKWKITDRQMLDGLAEGKKPREIAAQAGCSYQTFRNRLTRLVNLQGHESVEQAVANHVAEKIKRTLPLALQSQVDFVMGRKKG